MMTPNTPIVGMATESVSFCITRAEFYDQLLKISVDVGSPEPQDYWLEPTAQVVAGDHRILFFADILAGPLVARHEDRSDWETVEVTVQRPNDRIFQTAQMIIDDLKAAEDHYAEVA